MFEIAGVNGHIKFDGETVTILRYGGWMTKFTGRTIPLESIAQVRIMPPRIGTPGFLQIITKTQNEVPSDPIFTGIEAAKDEHSVLFTEGDLIQFETFRTEIHNAFAIQFPTAPPAPDLSVEDEYEVVLETDEILEDQWESLPGDQRESAVDMEALILCAWCAEEIFAAAKKCKHCGEFLTAEVERPLASTNLRRPETQVQVWPSIGGMICPHCQTCGQVTTKAVKLKKGVSGAKATAMLMTAGLSIFATGLSRKEKATEAQCGKCLSVWHF
jgi:hypothetical protein